MTDDWMSDPDRNCANGKVDPDVFFSAADTDQARARNICSSCPVRTECLTDALNRGERHGVWGAVLMSSTEERRKAGGDLRREQRRAARPTAAQRKAAAEAARRKLEDDVRALWLELHLDAVIALRLGLHPGHVVRIRQRLKLPALYGPKGRPINREQVSA